MVDRAEYRFALLKLADILLSNKNDANEDKISINVIHMIYIPPTVCVQLGFVGHVEKKIARLVLNTVG